MTRRTRLGDEAGQTIVLFAVVMPLILLLTSIAWDAGNWWVHRRHLQTQVDAAVLAAAPDFASCPFDEATANAGIKYDALRYAGDTARAAALSTSTVNQQVANPNNVHVVLNSNVYWQNPNSTTLGASGYVDAPDDTDTTYLPTGSTDNTPCGTSTIEAKASDDRVRSFIPWLPLGGLSPFPTPKRHARVRILETAGQKGMLPIAVPEIEPAAVDAIFVDYATDGTQTPIRVQRLVKDTSYGGAGFPYTTWVTDSLQQDVQIHPNNTYSDGTGVVIRVSKNNPSPSTAGSLNQLCPQTVLLACYAGTDATTGYDGGATHQGLTFIHSFATSNGSPDNPLLRDVNLAPVGCSDPGDLSAPYFTNDSNDCSASVTVNVDFGVSGDPTRKPNQGGICAEVVGNGSNFTWQSSSGNISTWTGTLSLPAASGAQTLNLSWKDKTSGNNCNSQQTGNFPAPAAAPYTADDASGPVEYLKLTASGPVGGTCPSGSSVGDANSVARSQALHYCYTVAAGFAPTLALRPWNSPDVLLRTASKKARAASDDFGPLNGALDCDHGRTLTEEFTTGCDTFYHENYFRWGMSVCGSPTNPCWVDIDCQYNQPQYEYTGNQMPPLNTVNDPEPTCIAPKSGQVQALQAAIYARWEDPNNGAPPPGGCTRNYWPTTAAEAAQFFKPVNQGGHNFESDPRYVTLVVTDQSAFGHPNEDEPVKYFAGFYVTGWDIAQGNGSGKPHGCYGFRASPKCGAPNNDAHPLLGCPGNSQYPGGQKFTADNGDLWGHWVKPVLFSSRGTPSDTSCILVGATSPSSCIAALVE